MDNNTPSVILELPGKFAAEVTDYTVDLSAHLPEGAELVDVEVSIDASGNGESPPELEVVDAHSVALASGPEQAVHFFLSGGTSGVRYRGIIEFGDDAAISSPSATRRRRRMFYIVVS